MFELRKESCENSVNGEGDQHDGNYKEGSMAAMEYVVRVVDNNLTLDCSG